MAKTLPLPIYTCSLYDYYYHPLMKHCSKYYTLFFLSNKTSLKLCTFIMSFHNVIITLLSHLHWQ